PGGTCPRRPPPGGPALPSRLPHPRASPVLVATAGHTRGLCGRVRGTDHAGDGAAVRPRGGVAGRRHQFVPDRSAEPRRPVPGPGHASAAGPRRAGGGTRRLWASRDRPVGAGPVPVGADGACGRGRGSGVPAGQRGGAPGAGRGGEREAIVVPPLGAGVLLAWLLALVLSPLQCAGEEFVFRALPMQMLGTWLRRPVLGILLPVPLFMLGHGYSWLGQVDIAVFAVVM